MTDEQMKEHVAKTMLGKVWDAQIDMFEEAGAADDPNFVMPPRWAEVPEYMRQAAAASLTPAVALVNDVMHGVGQWMRSEAN